MDINCFSFHFGFHSRSTFPQIKKCIYIKKEKHKQNVKTIKMKSQEITDVVRLRMCNLTNMTFSSTPP